MQWVFKKKKKIKQACAASQHLYIYFSCLGVLDHLHGGSGWWAMRKKSTEGDAEG